MDHTEELAEDALAAILGRLRPRDLAASRCVRKAWRAIVDARRLLLPHLLPHSVEGIFANCSDYNHENYHEYHRPHFLGRPSTQHPGVDYGNLHFLPGYTDEDYAAAIVDHCNGLLLYDYERELCVVNPATRRWERLPADTAFYGECCASYLAFDPAVSPHYEVFSIPPKDLGLFDLSDCKPAKVPPEELVEENFTVSSSYFSKVRWSVEVPQHSTEWPPPMLALQVFSSSTGEWRERSFVREGKATTRVVNVRAGLWFMGRWISNWISRWRFSAYWHGALYVLLCHGTFVMRLSLSDGKYQVVRTPIDDKEPKYVQHHLGRSEKNVLFAEVVNDRIWTWTPSESGGQVKWVLNYNIDFEPSISCIFTKGICKPWILDNKHVLDEYGNNKLLAGETFNFNLDEDNILDTNDDYGYRRPYNQLLGLHPYKEMAFFIIEPTVAVAYHLDSSKVQYIGCTILSHGSSRLCIEESFLYTPCMIGDLRENASAFKD